MILFILAAADVFIFSIPYYAQGFVANMHLLLHVSEPEYQQFIGYLGLSTLIGLIPSGLLADRFSSKWLCFWAISLTAILLLWWDLLVVFGEGVEANLLFWNYVIIYWAFGFTTITLFWSALWKLVAQQASPKDQAFVTGVEGTFVGIIGLLFIFLNGVLVSFLQNWFQSFMPFVSYVGFIIFVLILIAIGIAFLIEDTQNQQESTSIPLKDYLVLFRSPKLWLMGLGSMGAYVILGIIVRYFYIQIFANVIFISTFLISIFGGLNTYLVRLLVSKPFGRFADKRAKSYVFLIGIVTLINTLIGLIVVLFLPNSDSEFQQYSPSYQTFLRVFAVFMFFGLGVLGWAIANIRFVQSIEIERPKNSYASTVAFISFITFSPDAFFYPINSWVANNLFGVSTSSALGYKIGVSLALVLAFLGAISALILFLLNKRELKLFGMSDYRWRRYKVIPKQINKFRPRR